MSTEAVANDVWGSGKVRLLPATTLALGNEKAAMYTELAGVVTGAWRIGVGTTLAVNTADQKGSSSGGNDATDEAFQKFAAGGGNLSLNFARPVLLRNGNYNTQFVFLFPKVWANVPSLSGAAEVSSYGGEAAVEYQYQRYEKRLKRDSTTDESTPFLTLQVHAGLVHGSNPFYRAIGRADEKVFVYVAPTLSFVVADRVKLGVSTFYGPSDFRRHQNVRVGLSVIPSPGTGRQ